MRLKRPVTLGLATLAVLSSRRAAAVEGGVEDRVTTHAVAIATGGPTSPDLRCSGTLIAPNVVLTVRHCISRLSADTPTCEQSFSEPVGVPSDLWINATPWAGPSTSWKNVASWSLPEPSRVCGNDVALLVLASPYPESEATPARPVLSEAELRRAVSARVLGLAAFGASSASGTGGGVRRSRFDIPIQCVPGDPSFACAGALDYVDVRELTAGAGPCTGDSGAGAMLPSDRGVVFGVLSRGDLGKGTCSEGVFERTDVWSWLIAKTVLDATPPGQAAPDWARAAFPEAPRVGDRCRGAGACSGDSDCVSFDGLRSFVCAARCGAGCAEGTHCESNVCAPGPRTGAALTDRGCGVGRRPPSAPAGPLAVILGLASFACAAARRLRR